MFEDSNLLYHLSYPISSKTCLVFVQITEASYVLESGRDDSKGEMVLVITPNKLPVSLLQELAAIRGLLPEYDIVHKDPTGKNPTFVYSVSMVKLVVKGREFNSKKKAKHSAALEMLLMLNRLPKSSEFGKFRNEFPEDLVHLAEDASTLDLSEVQRLHASSGKSCNRIKIQ